MGAAADSCATRRDTGGLQNLIDVLKALQKGSTGSTPAGKDLRIILLTVLLAMAVDEGNRAGCLTAGLIPLLIQMLQNIRDDQVWRLPTPCILLPGTLQCWVLMHSLNRSNSSRVPAGLQS